MLKFNAPVAKTETSPAPAKDKERAYLNIGYPVDVTDPTTGETETVFINLPFGLGLFNMTESGSSTNPRMAQINQAKNQLLADLRAMAEQVKPGEAAVIEGLTIQLRRVGDAIEPTAGENPFLRGANLAVVK